MTWCARCGTSLSQHEVTATDSYRDVVHTALTVRFRLQDGAREHLLSGRRRPGRCPPTSRQPSTRRRPTRGCETDQAHVHRRGRSRRGRSSAQHAKVHSTFPGSELVGRPLPTGFDDLPVQQRSSIAWSPGTTSRSTRGQASSTSPRAAVPRTSSSACATGCPVLTPVDDAGAFYDDYGWLHGVHTHEATERIVDHLGRNGWLFLEEAYPHRYPVCWRCGTELIFRVVDEWFISADEVRQPMIDADAHASSGRPRTTASAWRTGSTTWATGASRASATGACRCRSTSAPRAI